VANTLATKSALTRKKGPEADTASGPESGRLT